MLSKKPFPYSLASIVILMYVLVRAAFFLANWEKSFILTWDVFGYYLYLPALFIYNDLGDLTFVPEILESYYHSSSFYYAAQLPEGGLILKYPAGLALMYSPFFLLGHLGAHLFGYPADGFSLPYQFAISMGSIAFVVLGLLVLRKVLIKYFDDLTVAICLLILVLGTNLFNYSAYDGAMPHAYLFTLYAIILWLTERWHARPRMKTAIALGLLIGLAALTRPINVLIFLLPLFWGISSKEKLREKYQLLLHKWPQVLILGLCIGLVGSIQLIYWKIYSGSFIFYSYEDQGFSFLSPHITDGLFSYRKGWLVYTPVMILALLGFIPFFRRNKGIFMPVLIVACIHTYIVFSWDVWWYGGAFGQRPMIDIYALLAFPLASLISYVRPKRYLLIATLVFAFLCIDLNLMMTWQAHAPGGGFYTEETTKGYFWKIFGSTHVKKADHIFLDVKHECKKLDGFEMTQLYFNNMEQDSFPGASQEVHHEGQQSCLIDGKVEFSPTYRAPLADIGAKEGDWIRVSAWIFFREMNWNNWSQPRLVASIQLPEKEIYREMPRLHWLTDPWKWHLVEYEFPLREKHLVPGAQLVVYGWSGGAEKPIWIDDLKVEIMRKLR